MATDLRATLARHRRRTARKRRARADRLFAKAQRRQDTGRALELLYLFELEREEANR